MTFQLLAAVARKELTDGFRDKRSLYTALIIPILGPATVGLMFFAVAGWVNTEAPLRVPVKGAEIAPNLIAFLERQGAIIEAAPPDYEKKVADGDLPFVLVIPSDYSTEFASNRRASVRLVVDESNNKTAIAARRARALLESFSRQIGAFRLVARGIDPQLVSAVTVESLDVSTGQQRAARVLNMIPLFLLMTAFMGGMHVAVDAVAGERERGSLEPLLVNPVARWALVGGKWVSAIIASWLAIGLLLAGFNWVLRRIPLEGMGIRMSLGSRELLGIIEVILPLTFFTTSLELVISTFSRTYREAQTYVSLIMLIPTIPSVFLTLSPFQPRLWMLAVPTLGQQILASRVLKGEGVPALDVALCTASALLASLAAVGIVVHLLKRESVIFGR